MGSLAKAPQANAGGSAPHSTGKVGGGFGACEGGWHQNVDQSLFRGWRVGQVGVAGLSGRELANGVCAGPPRRPEPLCPRL